MGINDIKKNRKIMTDKIMNINEFKKEMGNITFYDAVKLSENGEPFVDMEKAREIWMANLRRVRNIVLADFDAKSLRALENSDSAALKKIIDKKDVLRSMPENYDLSKATTWQELLNFWPEYLLV